MPLFLCDNNIVDVYKQCNWPLRLSRPESVDTCIENLYSSDCLSVHNYEITISGLCVCHQLNDYLLVIGGGTSDYHQSRIRLADRSWINKGITLIKGLSYSKSTTENNDKTYGAKFNYCPSEPLLIPLRERL